MIYIIFIKRKDQPCGITVTTNLMTIKVLSKILGMFMGKKEFNKGKIINFRSTRIVSKLMVKLMEDLEMTLGQRIKDKNIMTMYFDCKLFLIEN